MRHLVQHPTELAQWYELVGEASYACGITLSESVESYIVFMLMRYVRQPAELQHVIAIDFLDAQLLAGDHKSYALRDVADKCVILAGLFPEIASARLVRPSYFVYLAKGAYYQISDLLRERKKDMLYANLSANVVNAVELLSAARGLNGLSELKLLSESADLLLQTSDAYVELITKNPTRQ